MATPPPTAIPIIAPVDNEIPVLPTLIEQVVPESVYPVGQLVQVEAVPLHVLHEAEASQYSHPAPVL